MGQFVGAVLLILIFFTIISKVVKEEKTKRAKKAVQKEQSKTEAIALPEQSALQNPQVEEDLSAETELILGEIVAVLEEVIKSKEAVVQEKAKTSEKPVNRVKSGEKEIPKDIKKPYEYYNSSLSRPSIDNTYIVAGTMPMAGWAYAGVGICALNGKFYLINSRPKSYGAFLSSEDIFQEISYERFVSLAGEDAKGITEENALSYIPKEMLEKIETKSAPKSIEVEEFGENNGACPDLYSIYIEEKMRFGNETVELQKFDTGYRIKFEIENGAHNGEITVYDRLINDNDFRYICSFIPKDFLNENGSYHAVKDISIYGGEQFEAYGVLCDGTEFQFANLDYCRKLQYALSCVAKGPIKMSSK